MEKLILCTAYGDSEAYKATLENAVKIFEEMSETFNLTKYDEKNVKYLIKENLMWILQKVLSEPAGTIVKELELTDEIKKTLVLFLYENNIEIKNNKFDAWNFFKVFSFDKLPFLKAIKNYEDVDTKQYELVDSYDYDIYTKFKTIKNLNFKEGIDEIRKIRYILDFVNSMVSSDVKYSVIDLKEVE